MRKTKEIGIRLSVKDGEQVTRAFKTIGAEGKAAFDKIDRAVKGPSVSLFALNRSVALASGAMTGFVSGAASALIPTLSFAAAIHGTKAALEKFGEIADRAKSANLDTELFQSVSYQAKLAGVEIGEVATALDAFRKNAELAAEGRGKLFSQLKATNPDLLTAIQLAGSQGERLRLVADALDQTADKAALASAAFGAAGPRMVAVFEGGADAIDRATAKARAMGLIVDREIIAKADEYGDKWDTAATVIDTQVKVALTNLAPGMLWLVEKAALFAQFMNDATSGNKPMFAPSWGEQTQQHLGDVLRGLAYPDASVSGLPRRYSEGQYQFGDMESFFNAVTKNAVDQLRSTGSSEAGAPMDFRTFLDKWYAESLEGYPDVLRETASATRGVTDQVKANVETVREMSEAWRAAEDAAKSFSANFVSDLFEGKGVLESLLGSLQNLTQRLTQMALDRSISSMFSALVSGGGTSFIGGTLGAAPLQMGFQAGVYHQGGIVGRDAVHSRLVSLSEFANAPRLHSGLAPDEYPAILQRGEEVIPRGLQRSARQMVVNVSINPSITINGNNMSEAQIGLILQDFGQTILERVPSVVQQAIRNGAFG